MAVRPRRQNAPCAANLGMSAVKKRQRTRAGSGTLPDFDHAHMHLRGHTCQKRIFIISFWVYNML